MQDAMYCRGRQLARIDYLVQHFWFKHRAALRSLGDHPFECGIRKPGLLVAAPDVGVHTREPHLRHAYRVAAILVRPQRWKEVVPLLINGKAMYRALNFW